MLFLVRLCFKALILVNFPHCARGVQYLNGFLDAMIAIELVMRGYFTGIKAPLSGG